VKTLLAVSSLILTFAGAACSDARTGDRSPSTGDLPLEDGGTIVIGVSSSPTTLLPPLAAAALDFELGNALYPGLNFAEWRDGGLFFFEQHPQALARGYKIEGARLTYELDTSRRWSDGELIVAEDVVFTFGLLSDPDEPLPLSGVTARLDSVVAVDDSTVSFFFESAYPAMLFDTGIGILPAHAYGNLTMDGLRSLMADAADPGLVVSGAFNLAEWAPAERIVLERNDGGQPTARLDRIALQVMPDETTRRAALRTGDVDLIQLDSFAGLDALADGGFRLALIPQRAYDFIAWNPEAHPAFTVPAVRRALSLAIDRAAIINALDMAGFAEPAYGPYGSLFADLSPLAPDALYDPDEARQLLDEAGWRDEDGDGVRESGGRELRFRIETSAGNARREDAITVIQQQLANIGVAVEIGLQEFGSLFARARAHDYEAVLLGWQVGLDPDISFFWADAESPVNLVSYDVPRVTALMDSALAAPSPEAARPFWRESARLIAEDHPYAFLWFFDQLVAVSPRIGGVEVGVTGFAQNLHEWGIVQRETP
jgi:peptide/nickel transport system substrate-binding protein